MKILPFLLCLILLLSLPCEGARASDSDALAIFDTFVAQYEALKMPELGMGYEENFKNIPSIESIKGEEKFFRSMDRALARIDRRSLSDEVRYEYDGLLYEIRFNLERLRLEGRYRMNPCAVTQDGLYGLEDGKDWYRLYVRRWASKEMTPEQMSLLGESEVARVKLEIEKIQSQMGYEGRTADFYSYLDGPAFSITDEKVLQALLRQVRDTVYYNLGNDFEIKNIPQVQIRPVKDPSKDTPPGFYDNGVFYYTFFNGRFPRRSLEWLFLHEAMPGHHYQMQVSKMAAERPSVRKLFWYPGFAEGWAAYAEDLGKDLGCYREPCSYLGKWEWDLVRSARLVVDVGIHYDGWSRDRALAWWRENVPNSEDIAEREIDRARRWPAQCVSYKAGEGEILELRKAAASRYGSDFNMRRFHTLILQRGSIPLPLLREIVDEKLEIGH